VHRKRGLEHTSVSVQSPRVLVVAWITGLERRADLFAVEVDTGDWLRPLTRRSAVYCLWRGGWSLTTGRLPVMRRRCVVVYHSWLDTLRVTDLVMTCQLLSSRVRCVGSRRDRSSELIVVVMGRTTATDRGLRMAFRRGTAAQCFIATRCDTIVICI